MIVELATDILFASGSATLSGAGEEALQEVADVLSTLEDRRFQIEGHTDNQGGEIQLKEKSEARAQAVVDYLLTMTIDASRLTVDGVGMDRPVDTNRTPSGREANNRIELHVTSGEAGDSQEE